MSITAQFGLLGLDLQELTKLAVEKQQPSFRGKQFADAIYRQRRAELREITTLPAEFRVELATKAARSVGRRSRSALSPSTEPSGT